MGSPSLLKGLFYLYIFIGLFVSVSFNRWHTVAVCWGIALQAGRSWVRFPMVSLVYFIDIILPAAQWPWSLREINAKSISWGVRRPVCRADNLTTFNVLKSRNLKCLDPSGFVQACTGTALSFYIMLMGIMFISQRQTSFLFLNSTLITLWSVVIIIIIIIIIIRWFKYDRDWFVCEQGALRNSCATLRE